MDTHVLLDQPVEDFSFISTQSSTPDSFSSLRGKNVVLYFYPKDNTPGCTIEAKDFRDLQEEFAAHNTVILGVSRDSMTSHDSFKSKCELPFALISDSDESLCRYFNVIKEKSIFGKKVKGLVRSTFLIDQDGVLRREWRDVNVPGHVREVLNSLP